MDSSVVDENIVHLEVGSLTRFGTVKLHEGILQAVPRLLISDHLAADHLSKPGEDDLEIFVGCYRIQFADKQNILRGRDISVREIPHHFEDSGPGLGLLLREYLVDLLLSSAFIVINVLIRTNPVTGQHLCCWLRRRFSELETLRVIIGVMENNSVGDADVLIGLPLGVSDGVVQLVDHLLALHHLAEHAMLPVQAVQGRAEGEEELGADHVVAAVDHADEAVLGVADPGNGLSLEIASLLSIKLTENTLSASPSSCGVSSLSNEVGLNRVKQIEIVRFGFA